MSSFEIWKEGFLVTGMEGVPEKAVLVATIDGAATFQEACDILCEPRSFQDQWGAYDSTHLTVWGCRLFDNEQAARASFG